MEASNSFQNAPSLEYLKELSRGSFGVLWLARVLTGAEVGRLVVARRLPLALLEAANVGRILAAARIYSNLAHPSLVKTLDGHRTDSDLVLLEEHVTGVPLGKLQDLAVARQSSVPIGLGVKLVRDVLRAALALRRSCANQNLSIPGRAIFPDSVMVANFGEALLCGVGVTQELCHCRSVREHPDMADVLDPFEPIGTNSTDERFEVFTAGAMLWKLLLIRSLFNNFGNQQTLHLVLHSNVLSTEYNERLNLCVPKPIAAIIRRATQPNIGRRYQSFQEMIDAIEVVPEALLCSDTQVRAWLESIAGDLLSDLSHDSGIRRIPLDLPLAESGRTASQRASTIDTILPGYYSPVAARVTPYHTANSAISHPTASASAAGPDSCPATAITSGAAEPARPKRHVRRAYVIGTLLGLGFSFGLSQLRTQFNLWPTTPASTIVPRQVPTKIENLSPGDPVLPTTLGAAGQGPGVVRPADSSTTDAKSRRPTKVKSAQGVRRDEPLPERQDSKRSDTTASQPDTPDVAPPIPSSDDRWGI